jgi:hypothetical protein
MKNLLIILLFGLINCGCTNNSGPSVINTDKASDVTENQSGESWKTAKTISEVEDNLSGTWIVNPAGDLWFKLVVKSDKSWDLYSAAPVEGQWGKELTLAEKDDDEDIIEVLNKGYRLSEERYADVGRKYIKVEFFYNVKEQETETDDDWNETTEIVENEYSNGIILIFGEDAFGEPSVLFGWGPNYRYEVKKGDINPWN